MNYQKKGEHLSVIDSRISLLEIKQDMTHRKLNDLELRFDGLELNMKLFERGLKRAIAILQDGQETLITVLEGKGILAATGGH